MIIGPITVEIPPLVLFSQIVTAMESGSKYWIEGIHVTRPDTWGALPWLPKRYRHDGTPDVYAAPFAAGGSIGIKPNDDNKWRRLDHLTILVGVRTMLRISPKQFGAMMSGDGDDWTADVFLQCCLFDEVRYG